MKRMWSKNELKKIIKTLVESSKWSFEGDVTFNGLANFKDDVYIEGDSSIDGDFSVTGSINGEENPSIKPIYYHPIYITDDTSNNEKRLSFVILDNNSTAYTFDTFKAKVKELMEAGAFIQCNGYFVKSGIGIFNAYILLKSGGNYYLYGNDYQGSREPVSLDDITATSFSDGVNQIN